MLNRFRRWLLSLGPYQSLVVVLLPLMVVEPLKVLALLIAGEGHWLTGTLALAGVYAVSILGVERLINLLKPNLMKLPWLARVWTGAVAIRQRAWRWIVSRGEA